MEKTNSKGQIPDNSALRRGRKPSSGNVFLKPIFREEPDIEKIGRAVIMLATINEGKQ